MRASSKAELRERFPDLLVTGEGWYDALGAFSPISHTPGHIPAQWPETFARYNRCFLHLSAGDPSRGSTGVHELGRAPFAAAPGAPHIIPTLTVVDGTLEHAREQVDAMIAAAHGRRGAWAPAGLSFRHGRGQLKEGRSGVGRGSQTAQ